MRTNRIKIAVTAAAASALLLAGCGSGDSDTDTGTAEDTDTGETTEVEDDPQQPFWDEWGALSEQEQESLCYANEDFGEGWHVDYVADGDYDTDVDPDAWLEGLIEACEELGI